MTIEEYHALEKAGALPSKRKKYGNRIVEYKGEKYHSAKEARYAQSLDLMKSARDPKDRVVSWERQVSYPCIVNDDLICKYYADFIVKYADGRQEVVDVKSAGTITALYKVKKKLVEAIYDIEIKET